MTRHPSLLFVLAGLAMAVAGWNLGGVGEEKSVSSGLPPATRSPRPERSVRTRPGPTGEAAQRLAAIRATANHSERMRATIDLANSLSPTDLGAWLGGSWFTPRGGMEATVFNQILLERWRQEDPEGHLLWCRENDPGAAETLFMTWAETEPQRLLDFFEKHPDDEDELIWLGQIAEKHPELALRRFQEIAAAGISSGNAYGVTYVLEAVANQSPAALEAILDALPVSMKSGAEEILIGRKMQDAFATELRKLQERPDGLPFLLGILDRTNELEGKLIDHLKDLPASWRDQIALTASAFMRSADAAKWAAADLEGAGFTAEQARDIRVGVFSKLQSGEPETAFKILMELDIPPDQRGRMLYSLFQALRDKPEKAESLLSLLGSDADRQVARKAFQPPGSEPEPESKKIQHPAEWLAAVTALEFGEVNPSGFFRMLEDWEPEKIASLVAGFQSMPEDQKQKMSELCLASGMPDDFPLQGEVLAYFVAHPPVKALYHNSALLGERSGSSQAAEFATDYVVELGKENPEKAGGWIAALPDGEAKWYAARNLQSVWSLYDPAAAERWLKTLPAATREKMKALQGE